MVKYCAAYNCSNADTKLNRKQGITFHRFPKDNKKKQQWAQAVHRADPVSGKLWTPSEWDMICSQHFNPDCFKEINGKKFLKEGSCPSIFSFPDNFQKKDNSLRRSAKNSKWAGTFLENPPLTADPTEVYVTTDHHYHITDSPKTLKRKLDELLAENHKLRRKLRNASDQEERFHKNMEILLDKLHSKDMLSWEIT
ncbi:THAP domain-containing protein 6-like isoform X2 [Mauremys reevesii]|uniref:THAP domain-containing protein 6-like isoform X2 n=1 Tax=Mauremys reevesii TaxID=260615 RepID=UPI00193F1A3F|nr:THAP domain-containing protein 6-like isoform X2 [Mauremys reevesii]